MGKNSEMKSVSEKSWTASGRAMRVALFVFALAVVAAVLWFSSVVVRDLQDEELRRVELWADATSILASSETTDNTTIEMMLKIVQANNSIPVVVTDSAYNVLFYRNLTADDDTLSQAKVDERLATLRQSGHTIDIDIDGANEQHIFYDNSHILTLLSYYPYVQLGLVALFVAFAYALFSRARKSEQDRVWIGLARETAHQLGTPISALLGWCQILRMGNVDTNMVADEVEHDVKRLQYIAERFSKMGSETTLERTPIVPEIQEIASYLRTRAAKNINIRVESADEASIMPLHNKTLIGWAIENLCRNAIDAMPDGGEIVISVSQSGKRTLIDVTDNGRGMPKSQTRKIFTPGFTTKTRGWGIGLALTRRIVEEYHKGRIFVLHTELGKGTTIRMEVK